MFGLGAAIVLGPMQTPQDVRARERPHGGIGRALRRRWRVAAAVAGIVFTVVGVYVASLPNEYQGVAVVAIVARSGADFPGAEYVQLDAGRYIAFATAPTRLEAIAREAGVKASADALEPDVSVTLATNTSNLTITATSRSPADAERLANAVGEAIIRYSGSDRLLEVTFVTRATAPAVPSGPPRLFDLAIGLLVALLAGTAAAIAMESRNPSVMEWRDLIGFDGIPFLGVVPRAALGEGESNAARSISVARRVSDLMLQHSDGRRPVVAVASPPSGPREVLAYAIAMEIDAAGRHPLLLDANGSSARAGTPRRKASDTNDQQDRDENDGAASSRDRILRVELGDITVPVEDYLDDAMGFVEEPIDFVVIDAPYPLTSSQRAVLTPSRQVVVVVPRGTSVRQLDDAVRAFHWMQIRLIGLVGCGFD
jgi:capsular polysaccharide biosynthesis protein